MSVRILIAGVGNIFLGDDAFGVEVFRAIAARPLPEGASVIDYGIRGFDLAYALLDPSEGTPPWDAVILLDALARGEAPGTLYSLEVDLSTIRSPDSEAKGLNPHGMDPVQVLQLALSMGTISTRIYIIGCEPEDFGDELEGRMGLSVAVQSSVEPAVKMVHDLVGRIRSEVVSKRVQLTTREK
jgi:hydrogenase maturation protease